MNGPFVPPVSPQIEIRGVTRSFGAQLVLDGVSLAIGKGSCLALLGPSGSGKSTILNLIAGFLAPDSGEVRIGGKDVTHVPVHRRSVGVVFQNYALFPHLSVAENVAYPLRRRGWSRGDIVQRVEECLGMVQLRALAARGIATLSGGQQQRVAIARAIAARPDVVLMDEPLSALDKALRDDLLVELKQLIAAAGVTVVYVTHDQREALALADMIAVMREGRIEQSGLVETVYASPATSYVARFLSGGSVVRGQVVGDDGDGRVRVGLGADLIVQGTWCAAAPPARDGAVELVLRPEDVRLEASGGAAAGSVVASIFEGPQRTVQIRLGNGDLVVARETTGPGRPVGETVGVSWNPAAARVYPVTPQT